jgi:hypothetical protein
MSLEAAQLFPVGNLPQLGRFVSAAREHLFAVVIDAANFLTGGPSHKRAVLSSLAVSTFMPSGEKATELTAPACPWKLRIS